MLHAGGLIPASFYLRPVAEVAADLLGMCLCREDVALRITEVEAYGGCDDSASHCRFGRTGRNAPMWEDGGRAYIFLCYGVHHMLNIVTGRAGDGAAILVRACEPVAGWERIQQRRGCASLSPVMLTGPGKVAQALGLDLSFNHHPLYQAGGLELREGDGPARILRGSRVGIAYAVPADQAAALRFAIADCPWVSQRKGLTSSESGPRCDPPGAPAER